MSSKFEVAKFDGKGDFNLWKKKMKAILIQQKVAKALDPTSLPTTMTEAEVSEMNDLAHSSILLNLSDCVMRKVDGIESPSELWKKLDTLYVSKSQASKIQIKQKLYSFRMDSAKNIEENLDVFNRLILDLSNTGDKMQEEDQAIILINSLPESFSQVKAVIQYGRDNLTLDYVLDSIRIRQNELDMSHKEGEALYTRGRSSAKKENSSKQKGKGRSKSRTKGGRRCYGCNREGHYKRNCPENKSKENSSGESSVNVSDGNDYAEVLMVSETSTSNQWVLDSGCTFHVTPNRSWLSEYRVAEGGKVLMGNNQECNIEGIGSVRMKMHDGVERIIKDVRYVPMIKRNLISLSMLDQAGFHFKSENGTLKVMKGSMVKMKGTIENGLYILHGKVIPNGVAAVCTNDNNSTKLWHSRLGHMSERGMNELWKQGLLETQKPEELEPCEHCILGKSKRVKFSTGTHSTSGKLNYVHADLWGPNKVSSHGGGQYYFSIVDDYTRKVWVYILKQKSEALSKFREWKILVENQTDCRIKVLRTDNGLEFCSNEFKKFCAENGIARHLTVRHTPQQNGVAERMNRTIMEKVRCLLSESNMPKVFWAEAVATAVYLINRSPSTALNCKTPEEAWSKKPPCLKHLKPFGCIAYAHVRQGKLDPRAVKCVMLGYPAGVKGYKLWWLEGNKALISRDVTFLEDQMGYQKESKEEAEVDQTVSIEVEHHSRNLHAVESSSMTEVELPVNDASSEEASTENQITPVIRRQPDSEWILARDRSRREIAPPKRYGFADLVAYALAVSNEVIFDEPNCYEEAMNSKEKLEWGAAMQEEMQSLYKNNTWSLVKLPEGKRVVGSKWIYKLKGDPEGKEPMRFKARLVAQGYSQQEGVDYNEVFSPVVRHTSIRVLLAMVAHLNLELEQMDVRTAFLHGDLEETVYMKQPKGFIKGGEEGKVCLLNKSLYGLKQSPRQWYIKFDTFMTKTGYQRSKFDSCVYFKFFTNGVSVFLLLYVDDMLIASKDKGQIEGLKAQLRSQFDMKDLGKAKRILGIDIIRDRDKGTLKLSQKCYIEKVLKNLALEKVRTVSTPFTKQFKLSSGDSPKTAAEEEEMANVPYANVVGCLMYAMVCTRPDLAHPLSVVSRFLAKPGLNHWHAVKWILRYLRGTSDMCLIYGKKEASQAISSEFLIQGCVDADYAADLDKRRSVTGFAFQIWTSTISWKAVLQPIVALSSTEAEYIALMDAVKEARWLQGLTNEMLNLQKKALVYCDNQSAIFLTKNQTFHDRTKHIDVRYHYVREVLAEGEIQVRKIATAENMADMFTKALPVDKFLKCMALMHCGIG